MMSIERLLFIIETRGHEIIDIVFTVLYICAIEFTYNTFTIRYTNEKYDAFSCNNYNTILHTDIANILRVFKVF